MAITAAQTKEEIAARGQALYEAKVRAQVEPEHHGKFVVIDLDTGEYELDADDLAASLRAYRKNPQGVRYGLRVGEPVAGTIGMRTTAAAGAS